MTGPAGFGPDVGALRMTHDEAFLADTLERPEDGAPRLVYADWLEDRGQGDRAEFVRLQVPLATMPEEDDRRAALEEREAELLAGHERQWAGSLPGMRALDWLFRRDVRTWATFAAEDFLRHAAALLARTGVRRVRLTASASASAASRAPRAPGCPEAWGGHRPPRTRSTAQQPRACGPGPRQWERISASAQPASSRASPRMGRRS
jgi:uncharacterized protein (TIGR02996 family)